MNAFYSWGYVGDRADKKETVRKVVRGGGYSQKNPGILHYLLKTRLRSKGKKTQTKLKSFGRKLIGLL